ncbi:MAG: hypothetical protein OK439_01430 [Thaumarchaeota archaeon]|nr:hypothetical protein [Nitrososphaerota archaeon]
MALQPEMQNKQPKTRGRFLNYRFIIWWSIAWAIVIMALSPIVNSVTPLQDTTNNNIWTPDILWRLVLYWHGGIFIPWITALAAVAVVILRLDKLQGIPGRLLRESVLWGGLIAVPLAGIAGIFDVFDKFLLGIPLWTQIFAFLIGDEMAIALIVALIMYPRSTGIHYTKVGLPYFVVLVSVVATLASALMGHIGGWITFFGPTPQAFSQYINSTMYPVLGYYNSSAVIAFTQSDVGSHSHLMIPALMSGVIALTALAYRFGDGWSGIEKGLARFGFVVMVLSLLGSVWIYVVSGVGNFAIPTLFVSGQGGIAADDLVTGFVGLGALFVLISLLMHSRKKTSPSKPLIRDPLFLTVIASWFFIYFLIPITGYFIELNAGYYHGVGIGFDQAYTRFHQDFGFFLLPALVTAILGFEAFGLSGKLRRNVGSLLLGGITLAFVAGVLYSLVSLNPIALYAAFFGGVLIAVGLLLGANFLRKAPPTSVIEPKRDLLVTTTDNRPGGS